MPEEAPLDIGEIDATILPILLLIGFVQLYRLIGNWIWLLIIAAAFILDRSN